MPDLKRHGQNWHLECFNKLKYIMCVMTVSYLVVYCFKDCICCDIELFLLNKNLAARMKNSVLRLAFSEEDL